MKTFHIFIDFLHRVKTYAYIFIKKTFFGLNFNCLNFNCVKNRKYSVSYVSNKTTCKMMNGRIVQAVRFFCIRRLDKNASGVRRNVNQPSDPTWTYNEIKSLVALVNNR